MDAGYEDIERLTTQKQAMLDDALKQQNDIVNQQTQMNVDSLSRQKEDIDKEAIQQNKALYRDYKKATNPFGTQAETLASQGLGNSGYAETTMSRLYNTYQNNITNTLNNARKLKADVDFQIQQAKQSGNITLAQNALELYKQKMQLLSEEYDLRNNREQFLYKKQQDALAQNNWQAEFDYQKAQNDRNYNYQVSRDKVQDNQWQQNFDYQRQINDRNYNYQIARDNVADNQWQQNFDYQKALNDRNYDYQLSRDKVSDAQWQKEYELSKKAKASSGKNSTTATSINIDDDVNKSDNVGDINKNSNNNEALKKILQTVDAMLKKTTGGKVAQEIAKTTARQYLARAAETNVLSYEEAGKIFKKLGLEN